MLWAEVVQGDVRMTTLKDLAGRRGLESEWFEPGFDPSPEEAARARTAILDMLRVSPTFEEVRRPVLVEAAQGFAIQLAADDQSSSGPTERDVLRRLESLGDGVKLGEIVEGSEDSERIYWQLKSLRSRGFVVSRGRPLRYRLAGDPYRDESEGFGGVGTQGTRNGAMDLRNRVLNAMPRTRKTDLFSLAKLDKLQGYSVSQISGALSVLVRHGNVTRSGPGEYPVRYALSPTSQPDGSDTGAVTTRTGSTDADDPTRVYEANEWYWDSQPRFKEALQGVRDSLEEACAMVFSEGEAPFTIEERIKTMDSFAAKFCRKTNNAYKYDRPDQIEDNAGLRLTVESQRDVDAVLDALATTLKGYRFDKPEFTGSEVSVPTYRAVHLMVWADIAGDACPIEIQIRTVLQDAGGRVRRALVHNRATGVGLSHAQERALATVFGSLEILDQLFSDGLEELENGPR